MKTRAWTGSGQPETVPLMVLLPFNLLPFSRVERGVKEPLTWSRCVNPRVRHKELVRVHASNTCTRLCACRAHRFYLQVRQEHMSPRQLDYSEHV